MKKTLIILMMLVCQNIFAQDQTKFGIKTGVNFSIFSTSVNSESSFRTGFHIGGYLKHSLSEKAFFRPEIYFSSQGQKDDYQLGNISFGTTTTTVNYLNVPLLIEVGKKVSFQIGPQFGFLLSAHEKGEIDGDAVNDDLKDYMKGLDVSGVLGIGASPSDNFNLGMRLNLGLTDIFDESNFPSVKNRVFHLYVAYTF